MSKKESVLENKYGRWSVIYDNIPYNYHQGRLVLVQCSCKKKTIKLVKLQVLKNGNSSSCGCFKAEETIKRNKIHGYAVRNDRAIVYTTWKHIKSRCCNKNNKSYKNYGGRGISVCEEWMDDPKAFCDWALENGWKKGLQIDRINNDGNYEPSNCRFVTNRKNSLNKRLLQSNNKSGYCGVSYKKENDKYIACVRYEGKVVLNKTIFKTAKEAAMARDVFIIKNNLPHKLNFPELKFNGPL